MIEIQPVSTVLAEVNVPGSKSYTHRLLIAAALADGRSTIENMLESEDTLLTLKALEQMGVPAEAEGKRRVVHGTGGRLAAAGELYLGNSGTSMRLLTAVSALAGGATVLTGTPRMRERPVADLIDGLRQLNIDAVSLSENGCPPIRVIGGPVAGGRVRLRCGVSSQYLSGILLISPLSMNGVEIAVVEGPVSKPYIDMTVDVMARLGVAVEREGYTRFFVPGGQAYRAGDYRVETDVSNAGYFWAAAAVTGGRVTVRGVSRNSRQGDIRLLDCLERMGCGVHPDGDGIAVTGGRLTGITVDMSDMPDMVPTLGVVAAFADGLTEIQNVAHLRAKECDRLSAVAVELSKMGIDARCTESGLRIQGGLPRAADIDTYDDHRIAMAFSVAGLRIPGVRIKEEGCVEKSFPTYWKVFEGLYSK
ncbi:3-phosphoshikimate 1-carboxyvinyltransferase [Desulfococcus sp.]|uniref:3-phosphoshikimate 1-carboxyvinyltransferase n=1 Tax=Desulfococcus sp. TaxID=2025834 RepID=UPI0035941A3B